MCLLCYYPPQVETDLDGLENSCLNNPDGFGWSALDPKTRQISTFHSMNADQTIQSFEDYRRKNPETHALFHARYATAGSVTVDNCHPYQIGGGVNAVLGHNGHLSVSIPKGDQRSDTRVFAEDLFPERIEALDNKKRFRKLEKWAGGSKFVILSADPRLKKPVYLVNADLGHWSGGIWYSNHDYLLADNWRAGLYGYASLYSPGGFVAGGFVASQSGAADLGEDWVQFHTCPECRSAVDEEWALDFGSCKFCRFCFDCYELPEDCLCYWKGAR